MTDSPYALTLFNTLREGGWAAIEQHLEGPNPENEYIDFKRACGFTKNALDGSDQKNLGKALSGFANGLGGVLVWGIDYKEGGPIRLEPGVEEADRYRDFLSLMIPRATEPPITGVEFATVSLPNGKHAVLMYVPSARNEPVRSALNGHAYYMRAAESFVVIPHSILAAMFGRPPAASIQARWCMAPGERRGPDGPEEVVAAGELILENRGFGIGMNGYANVRFASPGPYCSFSHVSPSNVVRTFATNNRSTTVILAPDLPLPPYCDISLGVFHLSFRPPSNRDLQIEVRCGAGSGPPNHFRLDATVELLERVHSKRLTQIAGPESYWVDLFVYPAAT